MAVAEIETGALLREVARLHIQAQRQSAECCGGTTLTQCTILTELGRGGPMTLIELARRIGYDKSWTSRAVESLVQEGLLAKVPSETDRRTVIISLSDAGERRYQELNVNLNEQAERVMSHLPAEERTQVQRSLHLLLAALQVEVSSNTSSAACNLNEQGDKSC
ncbi:MAG TPA: MarR family transcriptional regulator [Chloroflexia bacterium]|nr:MarR family transcriptional regulator [Chloroflexia bacterium]